MNPHSALTFYTEWTRRARFRLESVFEPRRPRTADAEDQASTDTHPMFRKNGIPSLQSCG